MLTESKEFATLRDGLMKIGDRRVWSLIVTLFGDLAQDEGDRLSGPLMARILKRLDIKPEAMRVALHRLRNDGWIQSERVGRTGSHWLTDNGREQTKNASARIYAKDVGSPKKWIVAVPNPLAGGGKGQMDRTMGNLGFVGIGGGVFLGADVADGLPPETFVLATSPAGVPKWLRQKVEPEGLNDRYAQLEHALDQVQRNLDRGVDFSAVEIVALRVLIVHVWRYLVLRHPVLPSEFLPSNWRERSCRTQVHAILGKLGKPSIRSLERLD